MFAKLNRVRVLLDRFQEASLAARIQNVRRLVHNCPPVGNESRQEATNIFFIVHSLANLSDGELVIGLPPHLSNAFWGLRSELPHSTNFLKIWIFFIASGGRSLHLSNLRHKRKLLKAFEAVDVDNNLGSEGRIITTLGCHCRVDSGLILSNLITEE